jgi:hypothetical protein
MRFYGSAFRSDHLYLTLADFIRLISGKVLYDSPGLEIRFRLFQFLIPKKREEEQRDKQ